MSVPQCLSSARILIVLKEDCPIHPGPMHLRPFMPPRVKWGTRVHRSDGRARNTGMLI